MENESSPNIDKHDLVEPVVYRGGPMTAAQRNSIYADHKLPGIGKRTIQSEEEKMEKKACIMYVMIILSCCVFC